MKRLKLLLLVFISSSNLMAQQEIHRIKHVKITILSTMLAQPGIGDWGFSALVEADSIKILFDAGARKQTVLDNCKELNIKLSDVQALVLSHSHDDHTTGWLPLRYAMSEVNKNALSVTHVAPGFFDTRISSEGNEEKDRQKDSLLYVQTGGKIIVHTNFDEIFPGIFLTGRVPRKSKEKNYQLNAKKKDDSGLLVEDNVPEDMSLVIYTERGLVLLSGCGHSGIINTVNHVRNNLHQPSLLVAMGGFHLLSQSDQQIKWTAGELKKAGMRYFMGAHCTGIEPVYQIREWANLKRGECIVGSVGATFDLDKGFTAGPLTR